MAALLRVARPTGERRAEFQHSLRTPSGSMAPTSAIVMLMLELPMLVMLHKLHDQIQWRLQKNWCRHQRAAEFLQHSRRIASCLGWQEQLAMLPVPYSINAANLR